MSSRLRLLGPQQVNQQVEYVLVLLSRRAEYAGEDRLCPGSVFRAVAAPVLPDHYQNTHYALCPVVGRIHQTRTVEKREQVGSLVAQMLGQSAIGWVWIIARQQAI